VNLNFPSKMVTVSESRSRRSPGPPWEEEEPGTRSPGSVCGDRKFMLQKKWKPYIKRKWKPNCSTNSSFFIASLTRVYHFVSSSAPSGVDQW
jgi:hypothetical protein